MLPEQIRQKLAAAKAEHAALLNRQFALAERSVLSAEGERKNSRPERRRRRGTALLARPDSRDLLDRRLQAAAPFEAAVTEAVKAMREIAALGKAAFESWPGKKTTGAAVSYLAVRSSGLFAGELYRLGYVPMATGGMAGSAEMAPPPPKAPTLATFNEPAAITPLVTRTHRSKCLGQDSLGIGRLIR